MAIAFVSGSAVGANNPTSGNFPLGTFANGDVAIFWWAGRTNTKTWTDNSAGKLTVMHNVSTAGFGTIVIARRVLATGDVATDMAWTSADIANASVAYGTAVFSGEDTTTPIDAESGAPATFLNAQSPDPPAVVVATDQAAVVTIFQKNNDYGASVTAPTNYTATGLTAEDTLGTDASGGLAYRLGLGTGSEDPGAWTLGGLAGDDGHVYTLAIRPAAAATGHPAMRRFALVPGARPVELGREAGASAIAHHPNVVRSARAMPRRIAVHPNVLRALRAA